MNKEAQEYDLYADTKSELTEILMKFSKICLEQGRNVRDEIEDCIIDAGGDDE